MWEGITDAQVQGVLQEAEQFVSKNPYPYYADARDLWAEQCPPQSRAIFRAIRGNTPGRHAVGEHDPSKPTLATLSSDLRQLLDSCWSLWEAGG